MTPFEFVFALFGLVLGLSIAEVLGGLARAIKLSTASAGGGRARAALRIGWLTPLFGVLVLVSLTTFWRGAWAFRDSEAPTLWGLLLTLGLSGAYYLAAALVFPDPGKEGRDLDAHFMANRRAAIGAIIACNLAGMTISAIAAPGMPDAAFWIINLLYLALLAATALAPGKRWSLAGLIVLLGIHAVVVAMTVFVGDTL
ncbi:hypothetical protein [Sphingomonas cavernae]|uniref:Uncharacterized protein n=1 Tax=Sphingomonas cavernae TaxID=2320861 RepID=A0A418WRR9_9SPHN|nr:hypothetical protein [Sphingomonas cavernae]RJF93952.1 hypothetical protein D3876_06690 [Sphingomonas cavernae]